MCCPAYFRWWSPLTSIFIRDGQVDIDSVPESPPISRERFSFCPSYKLSTNPKFLWGLEILLRNVWLFHFISLYSHRKKIPITHIMHILYSNHILIPTSNYGYYASLFGWIFTYSHDIPMFSFQLWTTDPSAPDGQAISAMRNGRKSAVATRTVTEEMSATATTPETPEVGHDAGRSLKNPRISRGTSST